MHEKAGRKPLELLEMYCDCYFYCFVNTLTLLNTTYFYRLPDGFGQDDPIEDDDPIEEEEVQGQDLINILDAEMEMEEVASEEYEVDVQDDDFQEKEELQYSKSRYVFIFPGFFFINCLSILAQLL